MRYPHTKVGLKERIITLPGAVTVEAGRQGVWVLEGAIIPFFGTLNSCCVRNGLTNKPFCISKHRTDFFFAIVQPIISFVLIMKNVYTVHWTYCYWISVVTVCREMRRFKRPDLHCTMKKVFIKQPIYRSSLTLYYLYVQFWTVHLTPNAHLFSRKFYFLWIIFFVRCACTHFVPDAFGSVLLRRMNFLWQKIFRMKLFRSRFLYCCGASLCLPKTFFIADTTVSITT